MVLQFGQAMLDLVAHRPGKITGVVKMLPNILLRENVSALFHPRIAGSRRWNAKATADLQRHRIRQKARFCRMSVRRIQSQAGLYQKGRQFLQQLEIGGIPAYHDPFLIGNILGNTDRRFSNLHRDTGQFYKALHCHVL